ncbi:MAG TPA: tRNA lysidine(34) synthetase TilS [Vicinamibacterales bacterium]
MTPLLSRVIGTIRQHELASRGASVVAAVSGGSDSVALAALLREADEAGELRLVALAHFDHGLRGEAAAADARFCADLAARFGLPIEIGRGDVRELARSRHLSLEDAARQARYAFLDTVRARFGADRMAVGHTREDQAETFLLRMIRGAGTRGLAAIHPRVGSVIRPLLDCSRGELQHFLANRGLTYCEDLSNADRRITRNRLRHEVLPLLRREFNPSLDATLAREAIVAREDAAYLEQLAAEVRPQLTAPVPGGYRVPAAAVLETPRPLARRVLRDLLVELAGERFIGFEHVDAVLRVCAEAGRVDLPGQFAERIGREVVLMHRPAGSARALQATAAGFAEPLPVPGEVAWPEAGWRVSASLAISGAEGCLPGALSGGGAAALIDREVVGDGLLVRSRQRGDRFRPAGLQGHQKLQDFLVNRKVARQNRDQVPLVVDAENRIIWVAGHRLAEEFRVTDQTAGMVILKLEACGGRA